MKALIDLSWSAFLLGDTHMFWNTCLWWISNSATLKEGLWNWGKTTANVLCNQPRLEYLPLALGYCEFVSFTLEFTHLIDIYIPVTVRWVQLAVYVDGCLRSQQVQPGSQAARHPGSVWDLWIIALLWLLPHVLSPQTLCPPSCWQRHVPQRGRPLSNETTRAWCSKSRLFNVT